IAVEIKEKEQELLKRAEEMAERQKKEMYEKIQREGAEIIKTAIAKGVGIEPDEVDEKLIKKTASILHGLQS
ncbi:MAG: hypothetical protein Q7S82_01845, partial [bacterium]|nr:hypothetical protein [bacterium]